MPIAPATEIATCPLCGAGGGVPEAELHDRVWGKPGDFGLARCPRCGHAYLSPRPPRAAIGFYYSDLYSAGEGVDIGSAHV